MATDPDPGDDNPVTVYFTDKTIERFAVVARREDAEWLAGLKAETIGAGGDDVYAVRGESIKMVEAPHVDHRDGGLVTYAAPDADVETALAATWFDD